MGLFVVEVAVYAALCYCAEKESIRMQNDCILSSDCKGYTLLCASCASRCGKAAACQKGALFQNTETKLRKLETYVIYCI